MIYGLSAQPNKRKRIYKAGRTVRVLIYARNLSDQYGGVKEYIFSMVKALAEIESVELLHVVHNCPNELFEGSRRINEVLMNSNSRVYCDFVLGPRLIKALDYDVVWFPHTSIIGNPGKPIVSTVHDLAYFIPELGAYKLLEGMYMQQKIKNSCRRSTKLVTYSTNTKNDIGKFTGVPQDKVSIICAAADTRFAPPDKKSSEQLVVNGVTVPQSYFLYAGGITPRKNVATLVRAFDRAAIDNVSLIITGGSSASWRSAEVLEYIKDKPNILRLGFVSDDDMVKLYQRARIFVYPSLYEGFGLPIVEAQACGCPVITYINSSLPEVAGENAAYFVKDTSVESLAEAMSVVYTSPELSDQLMRNGLLNAARFSWKRAAQEFVDLFKSLTSTDQQPDQTLG